METLIVSLKEETMKNKKLEALKQKLEERYKKVIKEKKVLEGFVKSVFPVSKHPLLLDNEGKFKAIDVEQLKKLYQEHQSEINTESQMKMNGNEQ